MPCHDQRRGAFTLMEMIAVVAIIAVLLLYALPSMTPSGTQQLMAAADVVAGDLAQARSLAVTYGSKYRVTYNIAGNYYTLEHTGTNTTLDTLPNWAFRSPGDPSDQHIVRLDDLPGIGASPAKLVKVTVGGVDAASAEVEFDALGATTAAAETVVWLKDGDAATAHYIPVRINAVTGLVDVDDITGTAP